MPSLPAFWPAATLLAAAQRPPLARPRPRPPSQQPPRAGPRSSARGAGAACRWEQPARRPRRPSAAARRSSGPAAELAGLAALGGLLQRIAGRCRRAAISLAACRGAAAGLWGLLLRLLRLGPRSQLVWPPEVASEPWGPIDIQGWTWENRFSEDENLLNLAFAASLNTYRYHRGMAGGLFGAVLCMPPRSQPAAGKRRRRMVHVLGLGVHWPPRFASGDKPGAPGKPVTSQGLMGTKATTLHAEIMLVARCAREGWATEGSWLYTLQPPCWECCKALMMAGVARIVFQVPHSPNTHLRQQEVVAATGATWECIPQSDHRRQFLQNLGKEWLRQYASRRKREVGVASPDA